MSMRMRMRKTTATEEPSGNRENVLKCSVENVSKRSGIAQLEIIGSLFKFVRKNPIKIFTSLAIFGIYYSWPHNLINEGPGRGLLRSDLIAEGYTVREGLNKSKTDDSDMLQITGDIMAPSFLRKAMDSCIAAGRELGEYPSIYKELVPARVQRWKKQETNGDINILQMINDKLGGYLYATQLGVRTPQILFCGAAKDLPKDMTSLGANYVVKPLKGFSARGVKVIRDGIDIFQRRKITYESLIKDYGPEEETVVEELIESSDPKFEGLVPPDYKFYVYEGGVSELMLYIDRNKGRECRDYFEQSSKEWKFIKVFSDIAGRGVPMPHCMHQDHSKIIIDPTKQAAMTDAVQTLARNMGKNWIRIDMFDSKNGPILGEFTPFSHGGQHGQPFVGCVMSYMFIAHAEHAGVLTDDAQLISKRKDVRELKEKLGMENQIDPGIEHDEKFDFYPPEAREWSQYDQLTKCKKVMKAQIALHQN